MRPTLCNSNAEINITQRSRYSNMIARNYMYDAMKFHSILITVKRVEQYFDTNNLHKLAILAPKSMNKANKR